MHVLTDLDLSNDIGEGGERDGRVDMVHRGAQGALFLMTKHDDTGGGSQMHIDALLKTITEGEGSNEAELRAMLEKSGLSEDEQSRIFAGVRLLSSVNDVASPEVLGKAFEAAGVEKQPLTGAAKNNLPDAAFATILKGGEKDDEGLTTPRVLRKLPHHTSGVTNPTDNGSVDKALLRNALARVNQLDAPAAEIAKARKHLEAHARELLPESAAAQAAEKSGEAGTKKGNPMGDTPKTEEGTKTGALKTEEKKETKTEAKPVETVKAAEGLSIDISKLDETTQAVVAQLIKSNETLNSHNDTLKKSVEAMVDEQRTEKFQKKAASEFKHIPGTTEDMGAILKELDALSPELAGKVDGILKAADELLKKNAQIYRAVGTAGASAAGGSIASDVEARADELRKASQGTDNVLTPAQATLKALEQDPDSYTRHREETAQR